MVTDALVDALHSGHVRAALDVTDPEPLPEVRPPGGSALAPLRVPCTACQQPWDGAVCLCVA